MSIKYENQMGAYTEAAKSVIEDANNRRQTDLLATFNGLAESITYSRGETSGFAANLGEFTLAMHGFAIGDLEDEDGRRFDINSDLELPIHISGEELSELSKGYIGLDARFDEHFEERPVAELAYQRETYGETVKQITALAIASADWYQDERNLQYRIRRTRGRIDENASKRQDGFEGTVEFKVHGFHDVETSVAPDLDRESSIILARVVRSRESLASPDQVEFYGDKHGIGLTEIVRARNFKISNFNTAGDIVFLERAKAAAELVGAIPDHHGREESKYLNAGNAYLHALLTS